MKKYAFISPNGEVSQTGIPSSDDMYVAGQHYNNLLCVEIDYDTDDFFLLERCYYKNGEFVQRPTRPEWHTWDSASESWLPNLDAARESKLQQVAAELNTRLYLPCNGFDADPVSRGRISGTIARLQRGDGLPAGWMGWRDASNQQWWAEGGVATVLANLTALSCAIEDREQALLLAAWQHKAAIASLTSVDALLAYDITAGWPTTEAYQ